MAVDVNGNPIQDTIAPDTTSSGSAGAVTPAASGATPSTSLPPVDIALDALGKSKTMGAGTMYGEDAPKTESTQATENLPTTSSKLSAQDAAILNAQEQKPVPTGKRGDSTESDKNASTSLGTEPSEGAVTAAIDKAAKGMEPASTALAENPLAISDTPSDKAKATGLLEKDATNQEATSATRDAAVGALKDMGLTPPVSMDGRMNTPAEAAKMPDNNKAFNDGINSAGATPMADSDQQKEGPASKAAAVEAGIDNPVSGHQKLATGLDVGAGISGNNLGQVSVEAALPNQQPAPSVGVSSGAR